MQAAALLPLTFALMLAACGAPDAAPDDGPDAASSLATDDPAARVLLREAARIDAEAARIDSIFQALPLLRPADEAALTRYGNAQQLAAARRLGVGRLLPADSLDALTRSGALVRLEDSAHWVVRDLDHSQPLVVPALHALLTDIGERFQTRLRELNLPPYRLEVSSVLRSAADQAALRRINPNAAAGESTHEYATTVDILYSAYAAPAAPIVDTEVDDVAWLEPHLQRYADSAAERVAGRRSLELKAILGRVLIDLQGEGAVMVTLERLQPVFHMTAARLPRTP